MLRYAAIAVLALPFVPLLERPGSGQDADELWRSDLAAATAEANDANRPLLVVFR